MRSNAAFLLFLAGAALGARAASLPPAQACPGADAAATCASALDECVEDILDLNLVDVTDGCGGAIVCLGSLSQLLEFLCCEIDLCPRGSANGTIFE